MNKTILSVAVLAASGGYVAFANNAFDGLAGFLPAGPVEAADTREAPAIAPALPAGGVRPATGTGGVAALPPAPRVASNTQQGTVDIPLPRPAPMRSAAAAPAPAVVSGWRDGTYTGSIEDAYYGEVQVSATVKGGELTAVDILDYPQDRGTSRRINSIALPMLEEEAIAAQSARVDIISGATLTSRAYRASLDMALRQAGPGHA